MLRLLMPLPPHLLFQPHLHSLKIRLFQPRLLSLKCPQPQQRPHNLARLRLKRLSPPRRLSCRSHQRVITTSTLFRCRKVKRVVQYCRPLKQLCRQWKVKPCRCRKVMQLCQHRHSHLCRNKV
jgi:hypothetical protein